MATHELAAGPDTVHWGYYDASLNPILTVRSGDTLIVHTETGCYEDLVKVGAKPSEALRQISKKCMQGPGVHTLVGPVAVERAEPGDVLEVRFRDIRPRYDWGSSIFRPLGGGLPEDFPYWRQIVVKVDWEKGMGRFAPGVNVPLRPFFGNFGVAPHPRMGMISSKYPGEWGGNMDNKEFVAGSSVYLPVQVRGALFSIGDGHAAQGDGEACTTALEVGMIGTVELILRKDMKITVPRAETETHHILMGFDPILDNAVKMALRQAVAFLGETRGMSAEDAYILCSQAVDLRVTQIVNLVKGAHAMVPKALFK